MTTRAIFGSHVLVWQDGAPAVLGDRWVLIEGRRIAAVTRGRPAADEVHDRPGRFVLPGLLNLHNHCFSEAIARTWTEDGAQGPGGEDLIYGVLMPLSRLGAERLSPADRLAAARLGILQLLKGGSTTVMEPFRNTIPEMFEAAEEMGIRFYGAPYLMSGSPEGGDPAASGPDREGEADLATWNTLHALWQGRAEGRIRLAMSPHATDTCGPDLLQACAARARELGVPITVHLAQSEAEVALAAERHGGRTPTQYLDRLGLLAPDLLAAHCICSTEADLRLMASRGATVLNCPRTFARSGQVAPFARFARHGLRTLVATDGYDMDLLGELGAAAIVSKLEAGRADVATAPELLGAVTASAADAIGRPDLGRIAPGASADLTVVDMSRPHLQPFGDPVRAIVALANRADIDLVVVDGEILIEGGRYRRGDEAEIVAAGAAAIRRIWEMPEARAALPARVSQ